MKSQKGAALIVVMSLLAVSLMIGLMSMQSSQVDERLAGNYRAATEAQMHAEEAASALYTLIGLPSDGKFPWNDFDEVDLPSDFGWSEFIAIADDQDNEGHCHVLGGGNGAACYVSVGDDHLDVESGDYIIAMGAVGDSFVSESFPVFVRLIKEDSYGILSGGDISIDNNTHFNFFGALHANEEFEYEDKFVCNGVCTDKSDDIFVKIPEFDFDAFVEQVKNNSEPLGSGDDDCAFPNDVPGGVPEGGDFNGEVFYCGGDIDIDKGTYSNATLVAGGDIIFEINGISVKEMSFVTKEDIEIDVSGNFGVINSYFLAKEEIEIDVSGNASISGWFYSQNVIDIDIKGKGSSDSKFDGILIAKDEIEIDANGVQEFKYKPIPEDGLFGNIFFSGLLNSEPEIDFWVN